jgi:hypothetical protein
LNHTNLTRRVNQLPDQPDNTDEDGDEDEDEGKDKMDSEGML